VLLAATAPAAIPAHSSVPLSTSSALQPSRFEWLCIAASLGERTLSGPIFQDPFFQPQPPLAGPQCAHHLCVLQDPTSLCCFLLRLPTREPLPPDAKHGSLGSLLASALPPASCLDLCPCLACLPQLLSPPAFTLIINDIHSPLACLDPALPAVSRLPPLPPVAVPTQHVPSTGQLCLLSCVPLTASHVCVCPSSTLTTGMSCLLPLPLSFCCHSPTLSALFACLSYVAPNDPTTE